MNTKSLKMKKAGAGLSYLMIISLMFFYSCNSSTTVINGNWTRGADFGGSTRSGAYEFVINNVVYVGLGYGGRNGNQYLLDSYKYSLDSGYWSRQVAAFPGIGRELMISFSIGQKGYVGTGYNRYLTYDSLRSLDDFWEYDPTANTWTQLKNFPGIGRYSATSFTTTTNGYAGSGYDGDYFNDFYKYTPDGDTWTEIPTPPSPKRRGAMTFNISGKIYYFGGESNGLNNTDFYEYDPATNAWTNRTKISTDANFADFTTAVKRAYATTLTLNGYGYVICGSIGSSATTIVYQYDPTQDLWTKMTSFEGGARFQAIPFVVNDETGDRAFVGTGANGSGKLDDVWEWKPTQTYDPNN